MEFGEKTGEWPKWIVPHADHVIAHKGVPKVTPLLGECHVRRHDGEVTVLVNNAEEEAVALATPKFPETEHVAEDHPPQEDDPALPLEVEHVA